MKNEILCGSSCVKYILDKYNKLNIELLDKNMLWITELAVFLKNSGINNIKINCYNSNLFNDFKIGNVDLKFDGFRFLKNVFDNNISICEKRLTNFSLCDEIDKNKYIILCVESKIFNNDTTMNGGHYIILYGRNENNVSIINPIKEKYEVKILNVDFLVKASKNYGAWRILINEEE